MPILSAIPITFMADAVAASNAMKSYITPVLGTMVALAGLAVVFFLIYGGIQYTTSSGNPDKLEHAKRVMRNALIGLVLVFAAGTLTAILSSAYQGTPGAATQPFPNVIPVPPEAENGGVSDVLIKGIIGLLDNFVRSGAKPFLDSLKFFTESTPLMANNPSVFNLWLALVGITDVLFIVVVALLGFHVMSFAAFGLDEIEFKHLLPQLAVIFLLINTSIFVIDAIIGLSNGMINALHAGFPSETVWHSLVEVMLKSGSMGLVALLIMGGFLILSVLLLIYYVLRIVVLYLGAVLSPIIFLIWLLPAFKDFAMTAMKIYLTTIFVLFVHVVILGLAASIFGGMAVATPGQPLNPIMSTVVGIATILALLKTQGVMSQLSYASLGPKTARKLGGEMTNAISHFRSKSNTASNQEGERRARLISGSGSSDKWLGSSSSIAVGGQSRNGKGDQWPTGGGRTTIHASSLKTGQTQKAAKVKKP